MSIPHCIMSTASIAIFPDMSHMSIDKRHDMGWLRLVGSLQIYVSFAEYRLFSRVLWQKRPMILRSLLIVATLYVYIMTYVYRHMSMGWLRLVGSLQIQVSFA